MISANLLAHTVTLKKPTGLDRDRNETYEEYAIEKTRVEAETGRTRGSEGETPSDTATLYIDAAQSVFKSADGEETKAVEIAAGDRVEWSGREFVVQSVRYCNADGAAAHHWEVALK